MGEERHEVYERIPWETLEKTGSERNWLVYAIAGAVVVGALGYTFMQNRAAPLPATQPEAQTAITSPAPPPLTTEPPVSAPVVVAEADLYAVNPERLIDTVVAHAERFAMEYFSFDGTQESQRSLDILMPENIPSPEAPGGTQVFVDWVGFAGLVESGPLAYDVDVVVRSLVSNSEGQFTRQATKVATVPIHIDESGRPVVTAPPRVAEAGAESSPAMDLQPLPAEMAAQHQDRFTSLLGGVLLADGRWRVVAMAEGSDGVVRAVSFLSP